MKNTTLKTAAMLLFVLASTALSAQTEAIIESYVNKQGSAATDPPNYDYKCAMYDGRVLFVMPKGGIVQANDQGFETVGEKEAPPQGRDEFLFMIALSEPKTTYAVDKDGYIWQSSYPFREIVGLAVKR